MGRQAHAAVVISAVTRHRSRLVLHFWVAQWMLAQQEPWTRRQLAVEFCVEYPTARDWASAAVRAGMVSETKKGSTVWFLRA